MIQKIETRDDVREFFKYLIEKENLHLHPDTSFTDYINGETKEATYTKEEAELRQNLMNKAFEVCKPYGEDCIYEISIEVDPIFKFNS